MSLLIVPTEVLMTILSFNSISISDLYHVMCSCSKMNNVIRDSNKLWRGKFTARWPRIHFQEQDKHSGLWMEMVHLRLRVANEVQTVIQSMSPICYPGGAKAFIPQHVDDKLMKVGNENPQFVDDEISSLAYESENLTTQYYAKLLLKKLRTRALEKKWLDFHAIKGLDINAQPKSKQTMWMEGALLITQWLNMEEKDLLTFNVLEGVFKDITQRVKNIVMNNKHTENRQILSVISHVLFDESEMNIVASFPEWLEFDLALQSCCIDKVLLASAGSRECHMTILCIIYQEVARRMDIYCEPVNCDVLWDPWADGIDDQRVVLLRCYEFSEEYDGFTYINIHDNGSLKRPDSSGHLWPYIKLKDTVYYYLLPAEPKSSKSAASVDGEFRRMLNHFALYAVGCLNDYRVLKYSNLLITYDNNPYRSGRVSDVHKYLFEFALIYEFELDEALRRLQLCGDKDFIISKEQQCGSLLSKAIAKSILPVLPKNRLPTLKYAVGLVMNYLIVNEETKEVQRKICVIVSWDIEPPSPLYTVLIIANKDFKTQSFCSQDELELHPHSASIQFNNTELGDLGLHFKMFDGRRFVPNAEKKRHYPEDDAVALFLIGT